MPTKISQLEVATDVTASDLIQIVDIEDTGMAASGTNKRVTASLLAKELAKQPLEPGIVISGSSSGNAVRITQTGSGNALVVEDSTNPDATPLVVDSSGRIITNHNTPLDLNGSGGFPRIQSHAASGTFADSASAYVNWRNGTGASGIFIAKSRGGAVGTYGAVVNSDSVGEIRFACDDGEKFNSCARIRAEVDGDVGINDIPCRLTFGTVPGGSNVISERMRITSAGNVGIATTDPSSKLHVAGDLTMSSATVATSATAGTNGDVPAQVEGYLVVNINGTARKIPYYA
jgi:hypothetical protein